MQVPTLSLIFMILSAAFSLLVPIGLFVLIRKRMDAPAAPFFAGCAAFVIAVLVLESALHNFVLNPETALGQTIQGSSLLYALYGGLAAGIFEETARLVTMKLLKKRHNSPRTALMYGAGHGGMEVLLVLGMSMLSNISLALLLNGGQAAQILEPMEGAEWEAAEATFRALAETSPWLFLAGMAERIPAVILHISLSVLVWQAAVKPGKLGLYFAAVILHAIPDSAAVLMQSFGAPVWLIEGLVLLYALFTAWLAKKIWDNDN